METLAKSDAELLAESLSGDRNAFGQIVERYQSLVCAIAYSATGDLGLSEDLAQETFVTAWKRLGQLRDRKKLRAWLCGIVRNLANSSIRRRGFDISSRADPLEECPEPRAMAPTPREHAISKEEESILWRALEVIPDTYREPLILYYREQQSVRSVSEALELSEDAVKQRLSRGRKMLKEQVSAFVEQTLARTSPRNTFRLAVLAAIPAAVPKAAAAGVAATAAKGLAAGSAAGLAGGLLGTIGGLLGGAIGSLFSIINTRSPRERRFMTKVVLLAAACVLVYVAIVCALVVLANSYSRGPIMTIYVVVAVIWFVGLMPLAFWSNHRQRQIQIEDGTYIEPSFRPPVMSRAHIYANMGGSVLGSALWLVILACIAKDWPVAAAVAAVAAGIFVVSATVCSRVPDHYYRVAMGACSAVGVLTLVVVNLRWNRWTVLYRQGVDNHGWSQLPLCAMNVLIIGIISGLLLLFFLQDRSQRAKLQGEKESPDG